MKIRTRYAFDADGFMRLQKDIDALINNRNLDHQHVGRLYTNRCDIRSEDGLTVLNGRLIQQYDNSSTLRLQMGYSTATGAYGLDIYNAAGAQTITLTAAGNGYIKTGLIEGSTIIGGMIKTANDGSRIELTNNTLVTYSTISAASGSKMGLAWGQSIGIYYGDAIFFDNNVAVMAIWNRTGGAGVDIFPANGATLTIGAGSQNTVLEGYIKHNGRIGFFGTTPITQQTVSNLTSTSVDDILSKLNEVIDALQTYGLT